MEDKVKKETDIDTDKINNLDTETIDRIKKLLTSDPDQLGAETIGKEQMFDEPIKAFGDNGKEIVINVKAYVYEVNENGETVAPTAVASNDFYIPLDKKIENTDAIIETFMSKLIECMAQRAREITNNE